MNAAQRAQLRAEFAQLRMPSDNDNAKPDFRRITVKDREVREAKREWMDAIKRGDDTNTLRVLREAYTVALIRYHDTSELYWGRR